MTGRSLKREATERPPTDLTLGEVTDRAVALGPRLTAAAREHFGAGSTCDYDRGAAENTIIEALADEDVYVLRGCLQLAGQRPLTFNHGLLCQYLADLVLDRLDLVVAYAALDARAEDAWCDIQASIARLATLDRGRHVSPLESAAGALRTAVENAARPDLFAPEPPL